MKEYKKKKPKLVIGGTAQDFCGEYMAGGVLVLLGLGLKKGQHHRASFLGTGMHGGVIYLRGSVEDHQLGKEVAVSDLGDDDIVVLKELVDEYAGHFKVDAAEIMSHKFSKIYPRWLRPYGRLYSPA
jgi:glutamate synthase domain-containing protein 3